MTELTRDDVTEVLGPVMVAARDRVVRDRKGHDPGPPLEPGPVAEVVDILERTKGLLGESGSTLT